jgi:hypothetical protein
VDRFAVDEIIGDKQHQFEKFFLVKQIHTDIDDREIKMKMLVNASNIEMAKEIATQYNAEVFMFEPEIKSIVETKILEYFQSAETIEE